MPETIVISTPFQIELARLQSRAMHLHTKSETVLAVRDRLLPRPIEPGDETFNDIDALDVFEGMMPTFLFIKLTTLADDTIKLLWQRCFPTKKQPDGAGRMLSDLTDIPDFNQDTVRELRDIRNACAHEFDFEISWEPFWKHRGTLTVIIQVLWRQEFGDNNVHNPFCGRLFQEDLLAESGIKPGKL